MTLVYGHTVTVLTIKTFATTTNIQPLYHRALAKTTATATAMIKVTVTVLMVLTMTMIMMMKRRKKL